MGTKIPAHQKIEVVCYVDVTIRTMLSLRVATNFIQFTTLMISLKMYKQLELGPLCLKTVLTSFKVACLHFSSKADSN